MPEEKEVTIAEIIFHNDNNAYTVAVVQSDREEFVAVGSLPDAAKGRTYVLTGVWKQHPSYGEQFVFSEFREVMPTSLEGIKGFLASGMLKGIGKKTAASIAAKFG